MAAPGQNLRINGERLWDSLMELAKTGPGLAGGNNRQTLTDEDAEGRALFQSWCEAAGCTMGLDQMGNMFARPSPSSSVTVWRLLPPATPGPILAISMRLSQRRSPSTVMLAVGSVMSPPVGDKGPSGSH